MMLQYLVSIVVKSILACVVVGYIAMNEQAGQARVGQHQTVQGQMMADIQSSSPTEPQGIRGRVVQLTGNFMPRGGRSGDRQSQQPVQTTVWIFSGQISGDSPRWAVQEAEHHAQLLGQVTSDAHGEFWVELPAGSYTLMAQYDTDLYLNSFSGDGYYTSVDVRPGEVADVTLTNHEQATF